jgi:ankyrin repeat protein
MRPSSMPVNKQLLKILLFVLCIRGIGQDSVKVDTTVIDTSFYVTGNMNYNLILAADKGYADEVLRLLNKGADINTTTWDGITPLMYAIENQDTNLVKILVLNGADIDKKPDNGLPGLISAVIADNLDIAEYLIRKGAYIDVTDNYGNTPLMYASAYGYPVMTDMLLYYEAGVNKKNISGTDALTIASFYGDYNLADLLIRGGAEVNSQDNKGHSALHCAIQNGYADIADLLIDHGADINCKTNNNYSPVAIAVANNDMELTQYLTEKGANVNERISLAENPLSLARSNRNKAIKKYLLENGGRRNLWPSFSRYNFGLNFSWNLDDFMTGIEMGMLDTKFNIALKGGLAFRPWSMRVLEKVTPELSYQYRERRTALCLGIYKRINFVNINNRLGTGIMLGAKEVYTFGSYRGSLEKPDSKMILAPGGGIYWNSNSFGVNLMYEYLDYGLYKIGPGRIDISFIFNIGSKTKIYMPKFITEFN